MKFADITERDVERLLIKEARLLDGWLLKEWMELLTDDVQYFIPSLDSPDSSHETALFMVSDSSVMLRSRVEQLLGRTAWVENPRSRTRRLISNVEILEADAQAESLRIAANFAVWRFQHEMTDVYVGRYTHQLAWSQGELRIRERRAVLDMQTLRPHGKLSFIL